MIKLLFHFGGGGGGFTAAAALLNYKSQNQCHRKDQLLYVVGVVRTKSSFL